MNYFADSQWFDWHKDNPDFIAFAGQKCSIQQTGSLITDPYVHILRNESADRGDGLSGGFPSAPNALRTGGNSGYQAMILAIMAGAARVGLLGYDMRFTDGKSHWHSDHKTRTAEGNYRNIYTRAFNALPKELPAEVVNLTPGSALTCFPFQSLAEFIA